MEPFIAIWLGAAAVFIILLFIGFRNMEKLWRVKGLEDCGNYWEVKRAYQNSPTPEIEIAYKELRRLFRTTILIWLLTLLVGAILSIWYFGAQAGTFE